MSNLSNYHTKNKYLSSLHSDVESIYPNKYCNLGNQQHNWDKIYANELISDKSILISSFTERNTISNNINISTNSRSSDSINLSSNYGGINLISGIKGIKISGGTINLISKNVLCNSENIFTLKTKLINLDSNNLNLKINNDINITTSYGDINILSGGTNTKSISIISEKGGISIDSQNDNLNLLSKKNIIIDAFNENSTISIGENSKSLNTINIGNQKSKININSDLIVKGQIFVGDNSIKQISTHLSETNESLLLLAKNNIYGVKDIGIIGKNGENFIGFLYNHLQNEFFLSDNINFDICQGINYENQYENLSNLLIGSLNINNHSSIDSDGNIYFSQLNNNNLRIDKKGNIGTTGNLSVKNDINFNDKFIFNSKTGNCDISGILKINNLIINDLYRNYVGNSYEHQYISDVIQIIENELEFNHQIIYLSHQIFNEDILVTKPLDIYGNNASIYGNINFKILDNNYHNQNILLKDFSFNIDSEYYQCLTATINGNLQLELNNIIFNINSCVNYILEIDCPGCTLILNNIKINTNVNINNLIFIKDLKKLIIKDSEIYNSYLTESLNISSSDCQVIIKNSYLEGNYAFNNQNPILINNIIKNNNNSWIQNMVDIEKYNKII